jgi:hypothetical protein
MGRILPCSVHRGLHRQRFFPSAAIKIKKIIKTHLNAPRLIHINSEGESARSLEQAGDELVIKL